MSDSLLTKLSETGIKAIDFAQQSAQNIYKFLEKEAPLLLQEWLTWNFWTSLFWFIFGVIVFCIGLLIVSIAFRQKKGAKGTMNIENWNGDALGAAFFSTFGSFILGLGLMGSNLDWLQIWLAPRVYILENIKDLIK